MRRRARPPGALVWIKVQSFGAGISNVPCLSTVTEFVVRSGRLAASAHEIPAPNNARASNNFLRACFENISGGLAAGRGGWLRCSSVTDFLSNMRPRRASPSAPPRSQSLPDLFSKHALMVQSVRNPGMTASGKWEGRCLPKLAVKCRSAVVKSAVFVPN